MSSLSFLQFFFYFWLFPYSFLSSPGCFTLKSWVFWVHSNYVFRSPKKLKISVFSIQVHWENCKLTTKNARKTEENIRLLTALFSAFIENILRMENGSKRTIYGLRTKFKVLTRKCFSANIWGDKTDPKWKLICCRHVKPLLTDQKTELSFVVTKLTRKL